jgi:PqqD family protein of HPr-rel-A system
MEPEMGPASGRLYRLATENGLVWRSWDGEIVVLNEASGDTHRLDLVASAAFEVLLDAPADAQTLTRRVIEELGAVDEQRIASSIETVLGKFDELGLLA